MLTCHENEKEQVEDFLVLKLLKCEETLTEGLQYFRKEGKSRRICLITS